MKHKVIIISTLLILIANTTFSMYKQFNDRSMWYYNSPTPSAMLLISGNGNVGIGSSAPSTKLEVAGTVSATAFVGDGAGLTNVATANYSTNAGVAASALIATTANTAISAISATSMNAQGLMGAITVQSSGNVGIGTVSPVVALDVNGGIKVGNVSDCTSAKAGTIRWSGQHFEGCTGTAWRQMDYTAPPTIGSIIPAYGPKLGTTVITINGTGFASGVQVKIGGIAATNVTWISATQITAITPASATIGAKDVAVPNIDTGDAVKLGGFTYYIAPTISSVAPSQGTVGTILTISGTDFASGAQVTIGGIAATNVTWISATQITATTPANATIGAKDVTVTNIDTGYTVKGSGFTYIAFATGGTIAEIGGYRTHTFTSSGTFTVNRGGNVDYLVVAGGGGGGKTYAGAGGAGGMRTGTLSVTAGNKTVTIGEGGAGTAVVNTNGTSGTASNFDTGGMQEILAASGGGGGKCNSNHTSGTAGIAGGSGGGGGAWNTTGGAGGSGNSGQGYAGGAGISGYIGGGGGGAGEAGNTDGQTYGGDGLEWPAGSGNYYAGGGAAGTNGVAGVGGGGTSGTDTDGINGGNGVPNTGGGGGAKGGDSSNVSNYSGSGGSGIVIIRYPINQ